MQSKDSEQLPLPEKPILTWEGDDEVTHNGPLGSRQNYASYTEEEHEVWKILYTRQFANLQDVAYSKWLDAILKIGLNQDRLPRFADLSRQLQSLTKWTVIPVSGFLPARDYFWYLGNRLFPAVPKIRPMEQLEFIVEPDLFHDAFGHIPMHSDPAFAEFVEKYGKVCMQIAEDKPRRKEMARLYWFTVEYGLIRENGEIKVCGSGHMSGLKESRYSLTDAVEKRPFNLDEVLVQDYNPHILQPLLFVMDSYEQLTEALAKKAKEYGVNFD